MAVMPKESFEWLLVNWNAEEEAPLLPGLLQQALKSNLSIALVQHLSVFAGFRLAFGGAGCVRLSLPCRGTKFTAAR